MASRLAPALITILALGACNSAPSSALVKIVPVAEDRVEDTVRSSDDMKVEFLALARDLDNDAMTYAFEWSVDGAERTEFTTDTVPAAATAKGQVWTVVVTPTDGKRKGDPTEAQATIGNSTPTAEASTPFAEVISTDTLNMTGIGSDPDGDSIEMQYYWTNDGEGQPFDGPTVPAAFTYPGETWIGHAVAFDGEERSEPATIEIHILNGLPVVDDLTFSAEQIFTDTELVANVTASDPDDQPVELTYTWTVDGTTVLQGVDRSVLDPSLYSKHQLVEVTVVPNDSVDDGIPVSLSVTVLNTPPTAPAVSIFPEEPIPGIDDMKCSIDQPSVDPDGDTINYRVDWTVNGTAFSAASTSDVTGDTVNSRFFYDDEEWRCEMTPFDDDGDGLVAAVEVVPETWSGPRVFTPCGATGNKGPTVAKCATGDDSYAGTTLDEEVTVVDGIQEWTVPVDGTYRITARGAEGGTIAASGRSPGRGAIIRGDFELERGDVLQIAVGQPGREGSNSAGGGGGTWVMRSDDTPVMIAGGGGSTGYYGAYSNRRNGCDASATQYGVRGSVVGTSVPSYACSAKTTDLRQGGRSPGGYGAHGGAGINADGQNDAYSWVGGSGGRSWANGVLGGAGGAPGGFGGGGSGTGNLAAGGGGGYSGGDSGRTISGGGGSYNTGSNQSNSVGHADDGEVTIDLIDL